MFGFVCHVLAFALGIVWTFATVLLCVATDGVPPEEYTGPNRAAFGMLFAVLITVVPVGTWMAYMLIRLVLASRLVSLLLAQLPPVALGTALIASC